MLLHSSKYCKTAKFEFNLFKILLQTKQKGPTVSPFATMNRILKIDEKKLKL